MTTENPKSDSETKAEPVRVVDIPVAEQAAPVYIAEPVAPWQTRGHTTVVLSTPYYYGWSEGIQLPVMTPREMQLIDLYRTSRLIRVLATIDIIFTIIYGIFVPLELVFLLFPVLGFCATVDYRAWLAFGYGFFIGCQIAGRIVMMAFFFRFGFIFFQLIAVAVEFMIFCFVMKFGADCAQLTTDERDFLANSEALKIMHRYSWC